MKSRILAVACLLAMTSAASAAKINWEGAIQVIAVTSACGTDVPIGDHYLAAYQPANVGDSLDSYIGLYRQRGAISMKVVGALPAANKAYDATDVGSRGGRGSWTGTFVSFSTSPASVIATTATLALNAKVTNFTGLVGCTATLQGGFVRRRD